MGKGILALALVFVLVFLAGCAPQPAPTPQVAQPTPVPAPRATPVIPQAAAKEAWEVEWERLVSAAKREGKVVIFSGIGGEVRLQLPEGFKKRYGIATEWVTAGGAQLREKILSERRAGLYNVDIYLGGQEPINVLKPVGALDPKWQGKVVMTDPVRLGGGRYLFRYVEYRMGRDFLRQLEARKPFITDGRRLAVEWLSRGKYAVVLGGEATI